MTQFKKGMRVRYLPAHANGDTSHKDCQYGVVSSVGKVNVFVKYDNSRCVMRTGDEDYTAQPTNADDICAV